MPILEYRCEDCGHGFELLVLKSSDPRRCPDCGSENLDKLLSLPSVSSQETRKRGVRQRRASQRRTRREQDVAEVKRLEAHARDHDD